MTNCTEAIGLILKMIWDIVKALIPLVVAIITIAVNNKNAKIKQKIDEKLSARKELQSDICTVMSLVREQGIYFIDCFQKSNEDELDADSLMKYAEINSKILLVAREILFKSKVYGDIHEDDSFDFENEMDLLTNYVNELNELLGRFECRFHQCQNLFDKGRLYDQCQQEMIKMSNNAEGILYNYSKSIYVEDKRKK